MRLTIDGTTQTIEDWAADYGVPCALIRSRLRHGWSAERAVTEPMVVQQGEKLARDAIVESGSSPDFTLRGPLCTHPPCLRQVQKPNLLVLRESSMLQVKSVASIRTMVLAGQ